MVLVMEENICPKSCVWCMVSCVTCHLSYVACCVSPVNFQLSPVTCHKHQQRQPLPLLGSSFGTVGWFTKTPKPKKLSIQQISQRSGMLILAILSSNICPQSTRKWGFQAWTGYWWILQPINWIGPVGWFSENET